MKTHAAILNQIKPKPTRSTVKGGMFLFSLLLCISLVLSFVTIPGKAAVDGNPTPVQLYYVSLPEADALTVLNSINSAAVTPAYTYFSIAVSTTGTYIYYDQWEDGYASDIANPTSAEIYSASNLGGLQIWGNGLAADGCAPNIAGVAVTCTDANDVLHAGEVVIPYNAVSLPREYTSQSNVLDTFSNVSYSNNNGNVNWATDWVDLDTTVTTANLYRDQFGTQAYTNSNGTLSWTTLPWTEENDDGSSSNGTIYINTTSGTLRFRELSAANDAIRRTANLTGYSNASLSFTLNGTSLEGNGSENIKVQVSGNGGSTWTDLQTFSTDQNGATFTYDISSYIASNTTIRFIMVGSLESCSGDCEYWDFDNVNISNTTVSTSASGAAAGTIQVTSNQLRFTAAYAGDSIDRGVNLPAGDSCATLAFTLAQNGIDAGEDRLDVQASADGSTYNSIEIFDNSSDVGSKSYNISGSAAANTRIRFVALDSYESGEYWSIDDVKVSYNCNMPVLFDGKDKVGASSSIAMARATWATGSGTLNAFAHEMYTTTEWGTEYESPVGTNTPTPGTDMFEYSALSIMASQNNTSVQIDKDANGSYETTVTLQEGGTTLVSGISQGARVISTKQVQVVLLTGDVGSNYESRDMNLIPVSVYGTSYWSPVGVSTGNGTTTPGPTILWLYNPSTNSSMTFTCTTRSGSTTSGSIAARGVYQFPLTDNQAAHCTASQPFFAVGTVDSASGSSGQAWDWSFTLFPDGFLTTDGLVGLGLGRDPTSSSGLTENGSPLWVTPICDTYVYVDWDNNGSTDLVDLNGDGDSLDTVDGISETTSNNGMSISTLYSVRLFKPSPRNDPYDQSGARVWSRTASGVGYNGTPGCSLALAWGQDPRIASAGAPGLDVGTSVPPLRPIESTKSLTIATDTAPTGVLNPGDIVYYNISIRNAGTVVVNNVSIYDSVPARTTYVAGSTEWGMTSSYGTPIPDAPAAGSLPLSQTGGVLLGNLNPGSTYYVRFKVTLNSLDSGDYEDINNCDTAYTQLGNFTRCVTNQVATRDWGDLPSSYGSTAAQNGPRHSASSLKLGTLWDVETQGQATTGANGDDLATSDDEDGVMPNPNQQWAPSTVVNLYVTVEGGPGVLGGWFDWNNDGDIIDANEFVNFGSLPTGTNTVSLSIPAGYSGGAPVYARFRLSSSSGFPGGSLDASDYLGFAAGGEVEDYYWTFFYRDWGDLPNTFATDLAGNGPRHSGGTLILGNNWDAELNGHPSSGADGDDLAGIPDDEDGIALTVLNADTDTVKINANCNEAGGDQKGWLIIWFDWNHSGNFDTTEATFNQQITCDGTPQTLTSTSYTYPQMYYLSYRARLFNLTSSPGPSAFVGEYINGEVEDYYMMPTAATVSQLAAAPLSSAIAVEWQTYSEVNILGFRLYRASAGDNERTLIYETQAQYPGSILGAAYGFEDSDIQPGLTYYYWVEVLQKDGSSTYLDPVSSGLLNNRIYMPVIQR